MLVDLLRVAGPLVLDALRTYLATEEGRKFVAEARAEILKAVLEPGDPIPEARNDGSPG